LFDLWGFPVTNSVLLTGVVLVIIVYLCLFFRQNIKLIPGKIQGIFELFFEMMLDLTDSIFGSRRLSEKYLPFLATLFFAILFSNWLGLVPGVGSIGVWETTHEGMKLVPLFRAPAADLNFTLILAIISIITINFFAIVALGWKQHASKFFNFKTPIMTFVGFLELISEFVKVVSFSFRLFGNVFAGEVLLTIIGFLVPYFIPLPFLFLEVFVGLIQAFIFTLLTTVFLSIAVSHESGH